MSKFNFKALYELSVGWIPIFYYSKKCTVNPILNAILEMACGEAQQ